MESTIVVYRYYNLLEFNWDPGQNTTNSTFRQEIDWGSENKRNRVGAYLIADPNNYCNLRFFLEPRTGTMPADGANPVDVLEPIVEELDANNRMRRLFFIGPDTKLYVEPEFYDVTQSLTLYVYQVAGIPIKYFGL